MDNLSRFSIAVSLGPDRARIFLRGELDLSSVDLLRARFDETFSSNSDDHRSLILLDLTEIVFCDSTGLHALIRLADQCRRLGASLRLVNVPPNVRRVMELTDTLDQFNTEVDFRRRDPVADRSSEASEL